MDKITKTILLIALYAISVVITASTVAIVTHNYYEKRRIIENSGYEEEIASLKGQLEEKSEEITKRDEEIELKEKLINETKKENDDILEKSVAVTNLIKEINKEVFNMNKVFNQTNMTDESGTFDKTKYLKNSSKEYTVKEGIDSYEKALNSSYDFIEKYGENGFDEKNLDKTLEGLSDFYSIITDYQNAAEIMENMDEETMTADDYAHIMEVLANIPE